MEVIGGLGSIASLIGSVASAAKTLSNLKERYGYAPLNISLVSSSLWTVKAALEAIHDWRSSTRDTSLHSDQLDQNLSVSIESCAVLVAVIERKLGETDLIKPSVFDKMRFVRLDDVFKDFAGSMDTQVRALQLLLTIFQCRTMTEQNEKLQRRQTVKLFRAVRKSTAILSYEDKDIEDAASILSEAPSVNFEMDPILMRHQNYQRSYPKLYDRMMRSYPSRQSSILTVRAPRNEPQSPGSKRHKRNKSFNDDALFDEQFGLPFLGIPFKGETAPPESESETEVEDGQSGSDDESESGFDEKIPLETIQEQIASIIREQKAVKSEVDRPETEGNSDLDDKASIPRPEEEILVDEVAQDAVVDPREAGRADCPKEESAFPLAAPSIPVSAIPVSTTTHHQSMPILKPEPAAEPAPQLPSEEMSTRSWHASDHSDLYDDSADEDPSVERPGEIDIATRAPDLNVEDEVANVSTQEPDDTSHQKIEPDAMKPRQLEVSPDSEIEPKDQPPDHGKAYIDPIHINFGPDIDLNIGPGSASRFDAQSTLALENLEQREPSHTNLNDIVAPVGLAQPVLKSEAIDPFRDPPHDSNVTTLEIDDVVDLVVQDRDYKLEQSSTTPVEETSGREILAAQRVFPGPASTRQGQLLPTLETSFEATPRSSTSSITKSPEHLSVRPLSPIQPDSSDSRDSSGTTVGPTVPSLPTSPTRPPPPPPISKPSPVSNGPLLPESEAIRRFAEKRGNLRGFTRLSSKLRPRPPVPKVSFEDILANEKFDGNDPASPRPSYSPTRGSNMEGSIASSADSTVSSLQSRGQSTNMTEATSINTVIGESLPIERSLSKERKRVETIDSLRLQVKTDKSKNRLSRFSSMLGLKGLGDRQDKLKSLALAAESGDLAQLSICLRAFDKPSDIHKEITMGNEKTPRTAFMRAAASGSIACLEEFTKYGPDCTTTDKNGRTALHYALESRHAEAAQWLLFFQQGIKKATSQESANLATMADKEGITPVHMAAGLDETDTFEILLDMGAELKIQDNSGRIALHYAIQKQTFTTVDYILSRGGDVEAIDSEGTTPLMLAAKVNGSNIVHLLLENGAEKSKQDSNGDYAMHHAARQGSLNIVESLFLTLDDLEVKNNRGERPLHLAAAGNHSRVVRALARITDCQINAWTDPPPMKYGTRSKLGLIETSTKLASTPLHYACANGSYDAAEVLVTQGVNVNANQEDGTSPLMLACESGSFGLAQLLLSQAANPNCARAEDGLTALHIACKNDDLPLTRLLIDRGADLRAKLTTKNEETAIGYALRENPPTKRNAAHYLINYLNAAMAVTAGTGNITKSTPNVRTMNSTSQGQSTQTTTITRTTEVQGYFGPGDFNPTLPPSYLESEAQIDRNR